MADLRAARRYATALFNVAIRQNGLDAIERDLKTVLDLWDQNPKIAEAMGRPQIPSETKGRIWQQLLEGNVQPLLLKFILLLVDKRRIDLLPAIGDEFQRLSDEQRQIVRAQVTTATPLPRDQADALRVNLRARTGKSVELVEAVDPSIVGGVVLRIGDRIIDGSIRTQLSNLKRQLSGSRY
jgi:F-type H+-transporting ATPase subunit delta